MSDSTQLEFPTTSKPMSMQRSNTVGHKLKDKHKMQHPGIIKPYEPIQTIPEDFGETVSPELNNRRVRIVQPSDLIGESGSTGISKQTFQLVAGDKIPRIARAKEFVN